MQKRSQPPENTSRWFNKLVVKVKQGLQDKHQQNGVPTQVDTTATGEGCASREQNLPWAHKMGFGLVGDTKPFVSCQSKVSVRSTNLVPV